MTFVQEYTARDGDFGYVKLRTVVSDTYADLFKKNNEFTAGTVKYTNVFSVGESKKDLNTDDDKYAVDELSFDIVEAACDSEDDTLALAFCLNATDINVVRYIASFIINQSDTALPLKDNLEFVGKIKDVVKWKEVLWQKHNSDEDREEYSSEIRPTREINFSALSVDVALLDKCSFIGDIRDKEKARVDNILDRIKANNSSEFGSIFRTRPHCYVPPLMHNNADLRYGIRYFVWTPLANYWDVLYYMLKYSSAIIKDIYDVDVYFNIADSDLNFDLLPSAWVYSDNWQPEIERQGSYIFDVTKKIKAKISQWAYLQAGSSIFIGRDLLTSDYKEFVKESEADYSKYNSLHSSNKSLTLFSSGNMSSLLFDTARALGCYLNISQTIVNSNPSFQIQFISRKAVVDSQYLQVFDVSDSSFDVSSAVSSSAGKYFCQSTLFSGDGNAAIENNVINDKGEYYDVISPKTVTSTGDGVWKNSSLTFNNSDKFLTQSQSRNDEKNKKGVEYKRIIFSTNPTLWYYHVNSNEDKYQTRFVNLHKSDSNNNRTNIAIDWLGDARGNLYTESYFLDKKTPVEFLTSCLFVPTLPFYEQQQNLIPDSLMYYPSCAICVNIDGVDTIFKSLADYINLISARDEQYYKSERTLTIPFLNGFKKDSSISWKNLTLGSKVKIQIPSKIYTVNGFIDTEDNRDFVVVSISRKTGDLTTSIKLQDVSRFAYGETGELSGSPTLMTPVNTVLDTSGVRQIQLAQDLIAPIAIMIEEDGTAKKLVCTEANRYKEIGILLEDGDIGDLKSVKFEGEVSSAAFNFDLNRIVYGRNNGIISETGLTIYPNGTEDNQADEEENMCVELGRPTNANTLNIAVRRYIIDSSLYRIEPTI